MLRNILIGVALVVVVLVLTGKANPCNYPDAISQGICQSIFK